MRRDSARTGRRALAVQASVGVPDSVDELFAAIGKHFDRLDIVVSNAASGVLKPTHRHGDEALALVHGDQRARAQPARAARACR